MQVVESKMLCYLASLGEHVAQRRCDTVDVFYALLIVPKMRSVKGHLFTKGPGTRHNHWRRGSGKQG
jgi:hypothetical protein